MRGGSTKIAHGEDPWPALSCPLDVDHKTTSSPLSRQRRCQPAVPYGFKNGPLQNATWRSVLEAWRLTKLDVPHPLIPRAAHAGVRTRKIPASVTSKTLDAGSLSRSRRAERNGTGRLTSTFALLAHLLELGFGRDQRFETRRPSLSFHRVT